MSNLILVGDELRLNGETVAVLAPGLTQHNSRRGQLADALGSVETGEDRRDRLEGELEELDGKHEDLRDAVEAAIDDLTTGANDNGKIAAKLQRALDNAAA